NSLSIGPNSRFSISQTGISVSYSKLYGTGVPLDSGVSGVLPSANGGAGTVNGILKANGSGTTSAAVADTDYVAPSTFATALAGKQPLHANLTAVAGLTGAANQMFGFTGEDSMALVPTAGVGRKLLQSGQSYWPTFGIPVVSSPSDHNFVEACIFDGGLELV